MSLTASTLTTADLPRTFRLDLAAFEVARAARSAGLTLAREACRCDVQRRDCPTCLATAVRALYG
jgi:hypothetical protein